MLFLSLEIHALGNCKISIRTALVTGIDVRKGGYACARKAAIWKQQLVCSQRGAQRWRRTTMGTTALAKTSSDQLHKKTMSSQHASFPHTRFHKRGGRMLRESCAVHFPNVLGESESGSGRVSISRTFVQIQVANSLRSESDSAVHRTVSTTDADPRKCGIGRPVRTAR